jgi:hypothetical protein
VKLDTLRELAKTAQPPMHTARHHHAAVHHSQYVYVVGGCSVWSALSKCERYVCAESRWEVLPDLPVACYEVSAVCIEDSLYALGGLVDLSPIDSIQKLSLDTLTWELMQLRLPVACSLIPCFKSSQVYLVIKDTLYSFTPEQVKQLKTLPNYIKSYGASYYCRGFLYTYDIWGDGRVNKLSSI